MQAKAAVGYVPQDLALYPDLSAVENLTFFGQLYGLGGKELEGRISETFGAGRTWRTGARTVSGPIRAA